MQGGGLLRDQVKKEGRHRFHISQFGFQISNFKLQSDRDPLDKSGRGYYKVVENRGHFSHIELEPIHLILQEIPGS